MSKIGEDVMKIIATVTNTKQVGESAYRDISISKCFWESATIKDIDEWAKVNNSTFIEVKISLLDEK